MEASNPPTRSRAETCFMQLGMFILGGAAGLVITFGVIYLIGLGIFTPWKPLPPLPSPATHLKAVGGKSLYVETAQGLYYAGNVDFCLDGGTPCWEPAEQVIDDPNHLWRSDSPYCTFQYAARPAPRDSLETDKAVLCLGETKMESYYALRPDGRVWTWHFGVFSMGMVGTLVIFLPLGTLLGAVLIPWPFARLLKLK